MLKQLFHTIMIFTCIFMLPISMNSFAAENDQIPLSSVEIENTVHINQASSEELAEIKGIGPTKAQAIVNYRETIGKFKSTDELINVKGIGRGTLQKIQAFISL